MALDHEIVRYLYVMCVGIALEPIPRYQSLFYSSVVGIALITLPSCSIQLCSRNHRFGLILFAATFGLAVFFG